MKFSELQRLQRMEGITVLSADERIEQLEARLRTITKERDAMRAKIEAAEKEREELHALIAAVKKQANAEYRIRVKKEEECALLQAKISDLTINVEYLGNLKKSYEELIGELQDDRDDLRAKIEQMEQQKPVAWYSKQYGFVYMSRHSSQFEHGSILYLRNGTPAWRIEGSSRVALLNMASLPHGTVFYALPGAQGEEK